VEDALSARAAVIAGRLRGDALREVILAVPPTRREAWVDVLLGLPQAPPDEALPRGGVPYLPAGVDEVLTVLAGVPVGPTDVFVDVGSGLGRVALLAHLLTGARAHGIEIQTGLTRSARRAAAELGLSEVSFQRADASDVAFEGTVFFLYSPLTGEALRRVLIALRDLADRQPIVLATVGFSLDHERWLARRTQVALPAQGSSSAVSWYDAGPAAK